MNKHLLFNIFKRNSLLIFFALFVFFVSGAGAFAQTQNQTQNITAKKDVFPVRVFLFYSDTCPHCHEERKFLDEFKTKLPNLEVHEFEVSNQGNLKNVALFDKINRENNLSGSVPVTVIGKNVLVGFDDKKGVGLKIANLVEGCLENVCANDLDNQLNLEKIEKAKKKQIDLKDFYAFKKTLEGKKETPMFLLGIFLGLTDGINPCMFSVLIFLLTYLLAIGSRKKAVVAGLVFAGTTFVFYLLFMLGIVKIVGLMGVINYFRYFAIGLAFFAGVVMIKDFFFYGKWFSLEIPVRFKPTIENLIKKGTIPSAIALAIFSSLVELPCTSGLPLIYATLLTEKELPVFVYLVWYNIFFVLPLFVIMGLVALAWTKTEKLENFRLKNRKYMRLVAGILLVLLALLMIKKRI